MLIDSNFDIKTLNVMIKLAVLVKQHRIQYYHHKLTC